MDTYQIAGESCYTTQQVVKMVGSDFSQKRLEHLKNLRLIPPPIKVGTGNGTIGYYPDYVIEYVRWIESEHKHGSSYPDILIRRKDKIEAVEIKVRKVQRGYLAEKDLRKQLGKSLMAGKHPESIVKELPSETTSSSERISEEITQVRNELKHLFRASVDTSTIRLMRIKAKIERLEQLEAMKNATVHVTRFLGGFGGARKGSKKSPDR